MLDHEALLVHGTRLVPRRGAEATVVLVGLMVEKTNQLPFISVRQQYVTERSTRKKKLRIAQTEFWTEQQRSDGFSEEILESKQIFKCGDQLEFLYNMPC